MIGSFGWMELLLILFIVLIIFGAGKIPQLGEGLGKAIKGFKKSINEPEAMDVTRRTKRARARQRPRNRVRLQSRSWRNPLRPHRQENRWHKRHRHRSLKRKRRKPSKHSPSHTLLTWR